MAETNIKDVKLKIGTDTQFQSKLKDLPLNTLVGITDSIQEGDLDLSIVDKLSKAENALPKPTNETTGTTGQVLKKTASGSEWEDIGAIPEPSIPGSENQILYHNGSEVEWVALYKHDITSRIQIDSSEYGAITGYLTVTAFSYDGNPVTDLSLVDNGIHTAILEAVEEDQSTTYSNTVVAYYHSSTVELTGICITNRASSGMMILRNISASIMEYVKSDEVAQVVRQ